MKKWSGWSLLRAWLPLRARLPQSLAHWAVLAAACHMLPFASIAKAGGPPETLVHATVQPGDSDHIAMRWENAGEGVLLTTDGGETWQALCLDGVSPADTSVFSIEAMAFDHEGHLQAGHFSGGIAGDGTGCGFATEPVFGMGFMTAYAQHPSDPTRLYAIAQLDNEGSPLTSRTYVRDASGWQEIDASEGLLYGIAVAELPNDGTRLYELFGQDPLFDPDDPGNNWPSYRIRYSDDGGATWTEQPVYDVGGSENRLSLEGVDPNDPNRIVLSLHRSPGAMGQRGGVQDEVLVSSDRGATFQSYATIEQFGGLDIGPDGRVWIGDQGDGFDLENVPFGLWTAASLDTAPTKVADSHPVTCVRYLPGRDAVFLCARTEAGIASVAGDTFEKVFEFGEVDRLVYCPGSNTIATCQQQFTRFWCQPAHFERAPMCCAYEQSLRPLEEARDCSRWAYGPEQNEPSDAGAATPDAGGAGTGGDGPDAATGGSMPTTDGEVTTDSGEAGASGSGSAGDDGGCGCRLNGHGRSGTGTLLLAMLGLAAFTRRRLRRQLPKHAH